VAEAGRRYQRTFNGAVKHGKRNTEYLARLKNKVTHQGSLSADAHAILYVGSGERAEDSTNVGPQFDENGRTRCSVCAVFCGPFARARFINRSGLVKNRRGNNEHIKGNRIRDSSTFIR
jgi:hypothetical protein